jgi:hypothetical protein
MKYTLNFKSDTYGKRLLTNRLECLKLHLTSIKKQDGKMGRDISFSSGEALFEFTDQRDHQLKKLLYYHRKYGFEAKVVLSIEVEH